MSIFGCISMYMAFVTIAAFGAVSLFCRTLFYFALFEIS